MLRAYKTPNFSSGQRLTHSPAQVEKHAGQETPLHYTLDYRFKVKTILLNSIKSTQLNTIDFN